MILYSIGHSNVGIEAFVKLLIERQMEILVDVRSQPYSRYNPHFSRENLKRSLEENKIRYVFLGDSIGGKPQATGFRLENGGVDYDKLAESELFQKGLQQLIDTGTGARVSFMCAEADFKHCHRYWLITRALLKRGIEVKHILHSGTLADTNADDFNVIQPSLF